MTALRPLRAPTQDGALVVEPPLARVEEVLAHNRQRPAAAEFSLFGRSLSDLRRLGRQELLVAARAYLSERGEPLPRFGNGPLFMAGHQPELFHPGVWVKNFALNGLAQRHQGIAVNLIVDNDTAKSTALRLPAPPSETFAWPHLVTVPYDRWAAETPYEELGVADEELFASFAERVQSVLAPWDYQPIVKTVWQEVSKQAGRTSLIGERFTRARRILERHWGCHNLEVPVSRICQMSSFALFACHLLANLKRFHALYNQSVHSYRREHGLRSRNHPVPDLAEENGWLEVPLWAWRRGQSRRGRLMAQVEGDRIRLRVGQQDWPALPLPSVGSIEATVEAWRAVERAGYKIRSRALTNTLFARVFLCDLFVHGIGGGKYDELTDELMRRFYELEPPRFLVLSGTLLLPLASYPATANTVQALGRGWRDLHYNPERHMSAEVLRQNDVAQLMAQKESWIRKSPQTSSDRRERFDHIRATSLDLRAHTGNQESATRQGWELAQKEVQANRVLQRRDFSFCLYPEEKLCAFCTQLLE